MTSRRNALARLAFLCAVDRPTKPLKASIKPPKSSSNTLKVSIMVKAHIERVVDVPMDRSWEILGDFQHVQKIHPLVETVDQVTPDKNRQVGAVRTCSLYDGNKATERIESWDESNHMYKLTVLKSTLPMKSINVILKVQDVGAGKSKLVADMDLKAKYGVLGKLMERLVIKPQLGGAIGNLFAGVESYDKNGVEIQKGFKAKTPALVV